MKSRNISKFRGRNIAEKACKTAAKLIQADLDKDKFLEKSEVRAMRATSNGN